MKIEESRNKIDNIDDQLVSLLKERLSVASEIAQYKKENGLNAQYIITRTKFAYKRKTALQMQCCFSFSMYSFCLCNNYLVNIIQYVKIL